MKVIINKLFLSFVFLLWLSPNISAQDDYNFELSYQVDKIFPPLSITSSDLAKAKTIMDINPHYKSEWVKEYYSVEISAIQNGKVQQAKSKDATLTMEQKELMGKADENSNITVFIQYLPNNNLKNNEAKTNEFSFLVDPIKEAQFPGGTQQLKQYLKDNAVVKVAKSDFRNYHLTAVKFLVNEKGQVTDVKVAESSGDEKVDKILSEAICNMPNWTPANFPSGQKVKQEYVFLIGDRNSCVRNFFNIKDHGRD